MNFVSPIAKTGLFTRHVVEMGMERSLLAGLGDDPFIAGRRLKTSGFNSFRSIFFTSRISIPLRPEVRV